MGKGKQAAKTEIEKLKLEELSCRRGVVEVARMCVPPALPKSEQKARPHVCQAGRLAACIRHAKQLWDTLTDWGALYGCNFAQQGMKKVKGNFFAAK